MSGNLRLIIGISILILALYYTCVSLNLLLKSKRSKYIGIPIYVLALSFFIFSFMNMRKYDSTTQTALNTIMVAYVMGFIALHLVTALFFLIDDVRRIILLVLDKLGWYNYKYPVEQLPGSNHISRSKFLNRIGWIGGITLFSSFFIGIKNKYNYQVRRVKLKPNKSLSALKDLKLVHISDIHTGSFDNEEAVLRGIDLINQEEPDYILFTGDIVNHKTDEIIPFIPLLKKMKAKYGIYATLGNHDYGDYVQWESDDLKQANLEELKRIMEVDLGWNLMMNEHEVIERNGEQFAFLGVENWGANLHFPRYGKLEDAHKGLENKDIYKILLTHDPSHWDNQVRPYYQDIDLTLSGHTHGMQFGIELSWFKWSPSQLVYKQWAGLYQEGEQYLYVNRGFGFLGYKGRVGILPEITVIEFEV